MNLSVKKYIDLYPLCNKNNRIKNLVFMLFSIILKDNLLNILIVL